jgi:hypothetical protein
MLRDAPMGGDGDETLKVGVFAFVQAFDGFTHVLAAGARGISAPLQWIAEAPVL